MKEKVRRLEQDMEDVRDEAKQAQKSFVTFQHFDAVIDPLKRQINDVQKDIKEILRAVSRNAAND